MVNECAIVCNRHANAAIEATYKAFILFFKRDAPPYQEMHLGHYHHGRLDFDPLNIHPQCPRCNLRLHGNLGFYSERLIEEHGQDAIKRLRLRANTVHKYTVAELEAIIQRYETK